jgi:hypothetical protein
MENMAGDLVACLYVNCGAAPGLEGGRRVESGRHGRPSDGWGEEEGGGERWTGGDEGRLPAGEGPGGITVSRAVALQVG